MKQPLEAWFVVTGSLKLDVYNGQQLQTGLNFNS